MGFYGFERSHVSSVDSVLDLLLTINGAYVNILYSITTVSRCNIVSQTYFIFVSTVHFTRIVSGFSGVGERIVGVTNDCYISYSVSHQKHSYLDVEPVLPTVLLCCFPAQKNFTHSFSTNDFVDFKPCSPTLTTGFPTVYFLHSSQLVTVRILYSVRDYVCMDFYGAGSRIEEIQPTLKHLSDAVVVLYEAVIYEVFSSLTGRFFAGGGDLFNVRSTVEGSFW